MRSHFKLNLLKEVCVKMKRKNHKALTLIISDLNTLQH